MHTDVSLEVVMSLRVHPWVGSIGCGSAFSSVVEPCFSQVGQVSRVRVPQGARNTLFAVCFTHLACDRLVEVTEINGDCLQLVPRPGSIFPLYGVVALVIGNPPIVQSGCPVCGHSRPFIYVSPL